jgi:hypothetical protein
MAFLTKYWRGQISLAPTFWLGWVVPLFGTYIVLSVATLWLLQNFGVSSIIVLACLSASIAVISTLAVWRSATTYVGHKAFKFGARATSLFGTSLQLLSMGVLVYVAVMTSQEIGRTHDDDRIAEKTAIPSETHPMAGFWKTQSSDNFGLAISPAGVGKYSVSFCGPGGCFKPSTYRPDTPLIDDEDYQVINPNTLRVLGSDGWTSYHRAPSRGEQCVKEK